jgi:hypothetical protein
VSKSIALTKGYKTFVDEEDFTMANQYKWRAQVELRNDGTIRRVYAKRTVTNEDGTRSEVYLHRFILQLHNEDYEADHWDGNGLNNSRSNIRKVTHFVNMANQHVSNGTGFKGVLRQGNKFRACIKANGKRIYRNGFETAQQAHLVYNQMAAEYHTAVRLR